MPSRKGHNSELIPRSNRKSDVSNVVASGTRDAEMIASSLNPLLRIRRIADRTGEACKQMEVQPSELG